MLEFVKREGKRWFDVENGEEMLRPLREETGMIV